ncbi:MAG: nuclear transport factor 2 family protein [Bacteroidales bacterium]|nr:nuclear transport factor 2 family protein [Bacteroidales bacterium]
MEKKAWKKWSKGDPSGFTDIFGKEITYFDPWTIGRLDGLKYVSGIFEKLRGLINLKNFTMIDPKVQNMENTAVLTYNLLLDSGFSEEKWNCTEIYQKKDNKWEIIHTHCSFVRPDL